MTAFDAVDLRQATANGPSASFSMFCFSLFQLVCAIPGAITFGSGKLSPRSRAPRFLIAPGFRRGASRHRAIDGPEPP